MEQRRVRRRLRPRGPEDENRHRPIYAELTGEGARTRQRCDRGRSTDAACGDRDRRAWRGLRGHRYQPDLHDPDRLQSWRPASRADLRGQRVRRRLNDLLVRDDHRHPDLRHAGDARRQQRRRRDHGADHAAATMGRPAWPPHRDVPCRPGSVWRRVVLRRQHDHARDLRAVRRRGPQGHRARLRRLSSCRSPR